jgi:hypothetical protein
MALSGSLHEFDLSNIFLLIEQDSKTGKLVVSTDEGRSEVYFKNGQIVNTKTEYENIKDFTYRYLVKVKGYSPREIKELSTAFYNNVHLLSTELVNKGYVTPQEITTLVQTSIIDITCDMFSLTDGDYLFEAFPSVDAEQFLKIAVPANFIMLEAARRSDEWVNIGTVITDDTIFANHMHISPQQVHQPMGNFSLYAVAYIDGNRTVSEICDEVFFSKFHVYKAIDDALKSGNISLINTPDMPTRRIKKTIKSEEFVTTSNVILSSSVTVLIIMVILLISKFVLNDNIWNELKTESKIDNRLREYETAKRNVDSAILLYTLENGVAPKGYKELIKTGYVSAGDVKLYNYSR